MSPGMTGSGAGLGGETARTLAFWRRSAAGGITGAAREISRLVPRRIQN